MLAGCRCCGVVGVVVFVLRAGCRCLVWCVVCVFAGGVPGVFAVGEFDAMFMRVFPSCTTKE